MCDISVIIPTYNAGQWLRNAIDTALNNSRSIGEVIVIDDGSTDDSLQIARSYKSRIKFITQGNKGAAAARNCGISVSAGRYIKFLDADDYLLPNSLERQLNHVLTLPQEGISYGRMFREVCVSGVIVPHAVRDRNTDNSSTVEDLVLDPPVVGALLYPRKMLEKMGGFDERFGLRDDYELFVRALLSGGTAHATPDPIYVYRDHASPIRLSRRHSADDFKSLELMFKILFGYINQEKYKYSRDLVARGVAKSAWISARNAARLGHRAEAEGIFALAREISPGSCVAGRPVYRGLVRAIGPIAAEKALLTVKCAVLRCRNR